MIRDIEFNEEIIQSLIVKNNVGRNSTLSDVVKALNSIETNTYISLDAGWGAGKTTFIKQLEYLSMSGLEPSQIGDLSSDLVRSFQEKYIVFYYNAWENDHHSDPLQSILFSLIGTLYSEEEKKSKAKAIAANTFKTAIKNTVKLFSKNIIDIDAIQNVETMKSLVSEIITANKRKDAVSKIIAAILPEDKRLLFLVDELDRCSPNFAVGVLETMKHYYSDDSCVFLLATNNRQLVHTVKKHYGEKFNGYGYLDKFYDLVIDLPKIEIKDYIHRQLGVKDDSYYINLMPIEIARYLDLSPREANRYLSTISLVRKSLDAVISQGTEIETALTSAVFIPLALALKIKDITAYDRFVVGEGSEIIKDLTERSYLVQHIAEKGNDATDNTVNAAVGAYVKVMTANDKPRDRENYKAQEAYDAFHRILPIINIAGLIDERAQSPPTEDS